MTPLQNYLISPPLSAILVLIFAFSLNTISEHIGQRIFGKTDQLYRPLYFFSGLLVTAWFIWIICLTGFASIFLFQILFWSIIGSAGFVLYKNPQTRLLSLNQFSFNKTTAENLWLYALIAILAGYGVLSLAAPTDSDSLSYHLALPIDILNSGSLWFNKDNLHYRMAGFGEMINLLGLANGCSQLGAVCQMMSLLLVLNAYLSVIEVSQRLNLLILFLGIPALLFLLPNQKHQMTGILATSACFLVLRKHKNPPDRKTLVLVISVMLFACGIKYSFLLSAAALSLFYILKFPLRIPIARYATILALLSLSILGPQFLFRYIHFGDPFSPLFEKFLSDPDSTIVNLQAYIKSYQESAMPFPLNLVIAPSPGKISTILGLAALLFLLLPFLYRKFKAEVIAILFLITEIIVLGQSTSRFFLEPLMWAIPLILTSVASTHFFRLLFILARLQIVVVAMFLMFGVYYLSPSIISTKLRAKVMERSSEGYAESLWLNETLPKDARIVFANRSRAFLSRPFMPWEYLYFSQMDGSENIQKLRHKMTAQYGINYLVLPAQGFDKFKKEFAGELVYGPKKFMQATRNPFNSTEYELSVYRVK
jgi:hypothetical protein